MQRYRILAVLLLVFAAVALAGINSIAVVFPNDASRNTHIGAFVRNGTMYASLNDLITVLALKSSANPALRKMEVQTSAYTLTVTGNNPFVLLAGPDSNASIMQMPYKTLFAANSYFVPIASFLPYLNTILVQELTLNADETALTVGRAAAKKSAFDITGLTIDQKDNGVAIRLLSTKSLKNHESWLKPMGENTMLYITINQATADTNGLRTVLPSGIVKEIAVIPFPTSVQFVFTIAGNASSVEPVPVGGSNDVVFAVHMPPPEQPVEALEGQGKELADALDRERSRWKLDCIVIDAGHGGDDPGTIGVNRTKEKDVTLAIALKLGKLIEKNLPGVRVVYTRKTDVFIELYKRGQIANAAGGKLFISIHCNSAGRKPSSPNGFEIYLLRPGKTANALRIAERENDVVKLEKDYEKRYETLNEEHFILLTMAQSAYVKYSERFAEIVASEMKTRNDLQNNGVKQAGFFVLVGASMPNVLVETAYLSNKHDEKILRSSSGQQQIAESIYAGVKRYKLEYEKALSEGKEIETEGGAEN